MASNFRLFTYENALLLILGATFGIVFFDRVSVNFLMPFIVRDLHLTNTQIGLVGSALSLTWSISNIAAGRLSDTLGRRKPMLIGAIVVFSLCSFISGLATSFAMLIAARLFMGVAEGPAPPLSVALLAQASSPHRRGLNGGLYLAFQPLIAGILAPIVLVWLAQTWGWREAFYAAAIPGLIAAIVIAKFVRERPIAPRAAASETKAQAAEGELLPMRKIIGTRNIWLLRVDRLLHDGFGDAERHFPAALPRQCSPHRAHADELDHGCDRIHGPAGPVFHSRDFR